MQSVLDSSWFLANLFGDSTSYKDERPGITAISQRIPKMENVDRYLTNCPVCLGQPQWQWGSLTDPEDFCSRHVYSRYRPMNEPTAEEWEQASAAMRAAYERGEEFWRCDPRSFMPKRLWRCEGCGRLVVDIEAHQEFHFPVDSLYSYAAHKEPPPPNPWDTDEFAFPSHVGMGRRER
jgi:hypothetical protein